MHFTPAVLVVAGISIHEVSATAGSYGARGWGSRAYYSTPDTADNKCSTNQSKGYDWSELATGSFGSYGSNKFSGWSCSNSFGKRDLLTKRTFQSKCITSKLDDEPAVESDGDDKMSIKTYQVSSDQDDDVDIECHYTMPDESICKEYHTCASSGSTIENTQCGGAKKVTFKPHGKSKGKGCNIGVHSIEFDCETASIPPSYSTTSTPASIYSQPPTYDNTSSSVSSATTTDSSVAETPSQYSFSPSYSSSGAGSVPAYSVPSLVSTLPGYGNLSTIKVPGYGSSVTQTSKVPVETPSYPKPESPDVLPKCINSWLHLTSCKDNTDYDCFCKNADLVSKVYNCVSAWSDSDDDTNSGAGYFMGICAKYVPENPAIITGCPSTITPGTGYSPPTSTPNSPVSEQPPAYTGNTVTEYGTIIATITSCGAEVTDCPAASTYVQPSVETKPVESVGITPPPAVPCTTITYASTYVVPASYPVGESQGASVPASSYTTSFVTTVTVPLVQITTYTVTESGSTHDVPGLGYETPAPSPPSPAGDSTPPAAPPAYPTTSGPAPVGPVGSTSLGTTYVPRPSNTITPYLGTGHKLPAGRFSVVLTVFASFLFL